MASKTEWVVDQTEKEAVFPGAFLKFGFTPNVLMQAVSPFGDSLATSCRAYIRMIRVFLHQGPDFFLALETVTVHRPFFFPTDQDLLQGSLVPSPVYVSPFLLQKHCVSSWAALQVREVDAI